MLTAEQTEIAQVIGYTPLTGCEAGEPFPVETVLPASRIRAATASDDAPAPGWPMVLWRNEWYAAPDMETVEEWSFDSICETPDGDEVEPDAPGSWLRILGLI